jgi:lipopolysaccharide transport system permease protein
VTVNVLFVSGVALVLAIANLFYRDVKYLFEIVLTVWMFGTSVVYPIDRVGGTLHKVLELNPMTPIIEAYRGVVLRGVAPGQDFWAAAAVSVVVLLASWLVFHRSELEFAENV